MNQETVTDLRDLVKKAILASVDAYVNQLVANITEDEWVEWSLLLEVYEEGSVKRKVTVSGTLDSLVLIDA